MKSASQTYQREVSTTNMTHVPLYSHPECLYHLLKYACDLRIALLRET